MGEGDRALAAYRSTLPDDRRKLLERFHLVDMARKVVGVGSVGTRAFIALMDGRDGQDPLFLQVKEATASVLEDHLPASKYKQPGERVVQGQRLMQAASDIFLGWARGAEANRYFYWRQLRWHERSAAVETMTPLALTFYGEQCGRTLARAHARSGDPWPSPPTSAAATVSTARWRTSPDATPIRTSWTTRIHQGRRGRPGSRQPKACTPPSDRVDLFLSTIAWQTDPVDTKPSLARAKRH
jgi:hypothetical protein